MNFGGPEMLIVLVIVLLVFGGTQLPKLARSLGTAQHEFKKGLAEGHGEGDDEDEPSEPPALTAGPTRDDEA